MKKKSQRRRITTLSLSYELVKRIDKIAKARDIARSHVVREAVEKYLAKQAG